MACGRMMPLGGGPKTHTEGEGDLPKMRPRLRIAAAASAAALAVSGLGLLAPPAHAALSGSTTATFTINGGTLNITVPTSPVSLATVSAGALTASGLLGDTSVSDQRGSLVA